ncbi:MAG: GTPase [Deltaproteobacteria bacterium]|nr:GTPase [Deltaproteobacteria bacterium]
MGAAGRDFHNFNVIYKNDQTVEVVAFTAAQIPYISNRTYPLAGDLYPDGIPIYPEEQLPELIKRLKADAVVFSYSDISHIDLMHKASAVIALGADFILLGSTRTMLKSVKPVISVCAVRTGSGKSGVTKLIVKRLSTLGLKTVTVRHPMPYGDLRKERVQRFATTADMTEAGCTLEEMEEYEHLIEAGIVVYAGVDYAAILKEAEQEADVIVWDGGNNDFPFFEPSLEIVVTDPLRPGHEITYHPGEVNLRRADVIIINKVNTALTTDAETVRKNAATVNPKAVIISTESVVTVDGALDIAGKKAVIIEDGPTLTHGEMTYGAGIIAAKEMKAVPVDAREYAVGAIKDVFAKYPALDSVIPAMGYSPEQVKDLETSVNNTPADIVMIATPVDLSRIIKFNKPAVRVRYEVKETSEPGLGGIVADFIASFKS